MKKIILSLILAIFIFSVFYPAIYATEELLEENENIDIIEDEATTLSEDNIDNDDEIIEEEIAEDENFEVIEENQLTESQFQEVIENVQAEPENYIGTMNVESPSNNQEITIPDEKTLNIQGWAVSNDVAAYMIVVVDGNQVACTIKRTKREDVDAIVSPNYGGIKTTPNAGFMVELDISKLAEGNHEIRVSEVSRNHQIIASSSFNIIAKKAEYKGAMNVEAPTNNKTVSIPAENILKIQGWAVSNDAAAYMIVVVDGNQVGCTIKRTKREDVDKIVSPNYGGTRTTPNAGFAIELDISKLAEGNHEIRVSEVSRYHQIMASSNFNIIVKKAEYVGTMNVETPANNQVATLPDDNTLKIQGWAVSSDAASYMIVVLDGNQVGCTIKRTKREDVDKLVSPNYGGAKTTPNAGFTINLDISKLTQGNHQISVSEVSRNHQIIVSSTFNIVVKLPSYTSKMYIENPIKNKRYRSDVLEVQGWAITEESGDYNHVYLDDKFQAMAEGVQRKDVSEAFKSQYPKHDIYCGFKCNVDTSGLAEGIHKITVNHFSKYGTFLESYTVQFMISNTTTWGIDVSHHNGSINWNSVRDSGVNFAIIKIGEYRESSGRVLVDDHFEEYYNACKSLGIQVGGYFYSYAFDATEAAHEAEACLTIINGKSFDLPIFWDIEDPIVTSAVGRGTTNSANLTSACITFCDILNSRGYQAGVYSYRDFLYNYLNMSQLEKYNVWLAHYVSSTNYTGKYDLWQYTSSGSVPGISGSVDLDWCFRKY